MTNPESILATENIYTESLKPVAARVLAILQKDKITRFERMELIHYIWIVHHHSTTDHNSKLDGLDSISTNTLHNDFCNQCRRDPAFICSKCYAGRDLKCYKATSDHNLINAAILQNILFTRHELVAVNVTAANARIESFGEVENVTQARNYTRLIRATPQTRWGIWTKRPGIWAEAFEAEGGKPRNCTFILSSPRIDTPAEPAPSIADLVDHTFTVYSRASVDAGTEINCGGRRCLDCIKARKGCYYRTNSRNPYEIREMIK